MLLPSTPEIFEKRFRLIFEKGDWESYRELCWGEPLEVWEADLDHVRRIQEAGFAIESSKIDTYIQPNWGVFNDSRFEPEPTHSISFNLSHKSGFQNSLYFALANTPEGLRVCYYVDKPKSAKTRRVEIFKDRSRITDFLKKSVREFANGAPGALVSAIEVHYSLDHGFVSTSFPVTEKYRPGAAEYRPFRTLLIEKWSNLFGLPPSRVVLTSGEVFDIEADNENKINRVIADVGQLLVEVLIDLRQVGEFQKFKCRPDCELQVEEMEGQFGWPTNEERGIVNRVNPCSEG